MVQSFTQGERRVWVTRRDEWMFEWFQVVRIANVQSVRWVLGALNGQPTPVSTRRAQSWCARMQSAGLVQRAQLGGPGGSLVWATYAGTGLRKPNVYRQTTRHEVAVAAASARYATAGYGWQRDDKPSYAGGHQADGVAIAPGWAELIEVELLPKRLPRYSTIFLDFRRRLDLGEITAMTYLCNPASAPVIRAALETLAVGRTIAERVTVHEVYDRAGLWPDDAPPTWLRSAGAVASGGAR